MADLAERVDDLICSFDSAGETTMDTLSMLIFGWMLFGLVVLCVGKYVYNRFVLNELGNTTSHVGKDSHVYGESVVITSTAGATNAGNPGKLYSFDKSKSVSPTSSSSSLFTKTTAGSTNAGGGGGTGIIGSGGGSSGSAGVVSSHAGARSASPATTGYVPPTPPIRKRLTRKTSGGLISPNRSSRALHLPTATGADPEAVRWVNELIVWLHYDLVILNELLATWVASLNDFTAGSTDEVRTNNKRYLT